MSEFLGREVKVVDLNGTLVGHGLLCAWHGQRGCWVDGSEVIAFLGRGPTVVGLTAVVDPSVHTVVPVLDEWEA